MYKKIIVYPRTFNLEKFVKKDILKYDFYNWEKYKRIIVKQQLLYTPKYESYVSKSIYILSKEERIEEYRISTFDIVKIYNLLTDIFGVENIISIQNYFEMIGNTPSFFITYVYSLLYTEDKLDVLENYFPSFEYKEFKSNLDFEEVKE